MARTTSTAALALALIMMASGAALARPVTQVQAVAQRALLQQGAQCTNCLKANLQCSTTSLQCLPGTKVDLRAQAGCKVEDATTGQNPPLCRPPTPPAEEATCPPHGSITAGSVCENDISLNGQQCSRTCVPITLVAVCDLGDKSARSRATCAKPSVVDCQEGQVVDISKFSCSSTNSFADASKDTFYFPINKALSLTASKVKCPPAGKSCQYLVGALSSNGCKAMNADQMATVTVGSGPVDFSGACESPF